MDGWLIDTIVQKKNPFRIIGPVTIRAESGNLLIRRSLYFGCFIFNIVPIAQGGDLEQMIATWMMKWDRVIRYKFVVTLRMAYPRSKHASILNTQILLPKYSGVLIDIHLCILYYSYYLFQKVTRLQIILIIFAHLSLCVWYIC